ncbi:oligopeptide transporter 4-like protein [Tanacetum coccineum]|uniref:Oligopeptide transporter 4-like protein n=1 Tax=Tanacetum coccineum TaxID=301880 RepID=A0ABQ5AFL7_9ASTR
MESVALETNKKLNEEEEEHDDEEYPIEEHDDEESPIEGHDDEECPIEEHDDEESPIEHVDEESPIEEHVDAESPIEEHDDEESLIEEFLAMFIAIFLAILLHSFTLLLANFLLSNKPCCCDLVAFFSSSAVIKKLAACFRLSLITLDVIVPFLLSTHQVLRTIIAGTVNLGVTWYPLSNIDGICHPDPKSNSPWTCSNDTVFFDASVIWGLVGPKRIFDPLGNYGALNWFFLGGIMGPLAVWLCHKAFPSVSYTPWCYRLYAASSCSELEFMDIGVAFMAVLLYFTTGLEDISVHWWGTDNPQHCDLATCPTAKGVNIIGCPVF